MILAAGYGERMLPLSSTLPKPLLPVLGTALLEVTAAKLARCGALETHCNLFHLPDAIEGHAKRAGLEIAFHRERELLGTGGGIGNMADAVAGFDATLLMNGDVLCDADYAPALSFHEARGALVTLVLAPPGPRANVLVGDDGAIVAIGESAEAAGAHGTSLGYTGLAILSRESLAFFPRGARMGLVPILTGMIRERPGSVRGYDLSASGAPFAWGETGSPGGYLDIHRRILVDKTRFDPLLEPPPLPLHVGDGASVDPGARWSGFLDVGPRAVVGRGAILESCVVLEGAEVRANARHANEIVFRGGSLRETEGEEP